MKRIHPKTLFYAYTGNTYYYFVHNLPDVWDALIVQSTSTRGFYGLWDVGDELGIIDEIVEEWSYVDSIV